MTPEQRMGKILDILKAFRREWTIGETLGRLESEIIKPAIEEEREDVARMLEGAASAASGLTADYRAKGWLEAASAAESVSMHLTLMVNRIRARSEQSKTDSN